MKRVSQRKSIQKMPVQIFGWQINKSCSKNCYISSLSSSSSSSPSSSSSSFFASSAFFASSSSFFLAASMAFNAFHLAANVSASDLSSVMMILSKIVPLFTCHRSKPMNPKSAYLYTSLSSSNSGLSIFFSSHTPLYSGFEIRFTLHSPSYSGLSFIGASHSPSSSSSQSSGFDASSSTMRFSETQSSG